MSGFDYDKVGVPAREPQREEPRSSFAYELTAKGDGKLTAKVYANDDEAAVKRAHTLARDEFIAGIEWFKSKGLRAA